MDSSTYQAFWSYAHSDNERQQGRVLSLADALLDEFAVSTGDDLEMFRDRKSLQWGDIWRDRIDAALGQVPFFVAVITPKFVRSEECRRELLAFNGATADGARNKLILPILYIPVEGLTEDSDDEVLALIARTQYFDFTHLRLRGADDPDVLQAVNQLALRLRDLGNEVSTDKVANEFRTETESADDLQTTLEFIGERLEAWMDGVEFDKVAGSQFRSIRDQRMARAARLSDMSGQKGAIRSVFVKLGQELLPIAEDRLEKAKNYSRLTIELDPFVTSAIRQVNERPIFSPLLDPLRDGVEEAYLNMEPPNPDQDGYHIPFETFKYSQGLAEAARVISDSYIYVKDGNEIVMQWRERLSEVKADAELADDEPNFY
jgi:hypothetical protein